MISSVVHHNVKHKKSSKDRCKLTHSSCSLLFVHLQSKCKLPEGFVVAGTRGSVRGECPGVQVHSEAGGPGLGECWDSPLGASSGKDTSQQYILLESSLYSAAHCIVGLTV